MSEVQTHVEHKSHKKQYFVIFIILAVLTALEVGVAEIDGLTKMVKGVSLTLLAVAKALIVAMYYMHLNEETRWLKFIASIPLLAAVFATVLCLEGYFKPF